MSSTVSNIFHFKRMMPMAVAARFGAFRNLFGQQDSLRHASALSSAILRNMSSTAVGGTSQLVDPSESFEEKHRHYSFITVMAIMSLFILITISMVALILGFCRKKNTIFALSGSGQDKNSHANISQFELDSLDVDSEDVDTKACKDDPGGVCYYHLSDDDDDDSLYDSEEMGDEGYIQVSTNNAQTSGKTSNRSRRSDNSDRQKNKKHQSQRKRRKGKLRFRDSKYYYHLHNDDGEGSCDEYSFHQSGSIVKPDIDDFHGGGSTTTTISPVLPKRSTTFPQLHSVLTSCIKGDASSGMQPAQLSYQKLYSPSSSSSPQSLTEGMCGSYSNSSNTNAARSDRVDASSPTFTRTTAAVTTAITSCDSKNVILGKRTSQRVLHKNTSDHPKPTNPQIIACKVVCKDNCQKRNDSSVVLSPLGSQLSKTSKIGVKKQQVLLAGPRRSRQSAFIPTKRKRRLFKSYSLHDIPQGRTNKILHGHTLHTVTTNKRSNYSGIPCHQGSHQVTFKVGTSGGDTDIRLHHV